MKQLTTKFPSLVTISLHLCISTVAMIPHTHDVLGTLGVPVIKSHGCGDREVHQDLSRHHCPACVRINPPVAATRGYTALALTPETTLPPVETTNRDSLFIRRAHLRGPPLPSV
jgi:hypothetical protein